jgi:hypothetical protein
MTPRKLVRILNLLVRLRAQGPINEVAIALLLTECRFRTLPVRIAEFAVALFLLVVLRKEPTLTLGKCQVSFSYWRARFGANKIRLLLSTFDDVASYEICCDYLDSIPDSSIRDVLVLYNGRPSTLYVNVFENNLFLVKVAREVLSARKPTFRQRPVNSLLPVTPGNDAAERSAGSLFNDRAGAPWTRSLAQCARFRRPRRRASR